MFEKVTAEQCVRELKDQAFRRSTTAAMLATSLGTSSRAVATALRQPCRDGRVKRTFVKGLAWYRFIRLTPAKET